MEFLKDNARAIIIALLALGVVLAISVSSNNDTDTANDAESSESAEAEENASTNEENQENSDSENSGDNEAGEGDSESQDGESAEAPIEKTEDEFSVSAVEGDNQTKLVRRVVARYADEKDIELSAEQKLAVETKLVNSLEKDDLIFVGDTVRLSEADIQAEVESAQNLSEAQLALWAQYL